MMKLIMYMFMLNLVVMFLEKKFLILILMNLVFLLSLIFFFTLNYGYNWMLIYNWLGFDNFSMILVLLTIWILGIMFLSSVQFKDLKFYSFILVILLISLFLSFASINYFMFYLFFEISLIPTFLLIMGWGYQPERLNAGMYMLLYTMFASLPLLIIIFYLYDYMDSLNLMILLNKVLFMNFNGFIIYMYMIFAFLIKLPLFMFHLWLPKAHIEAPVTGSVILAAIMLKLGGYGLMRSLMIMKNLSKEFNYLFFIISLVGMIYLSMVNLRCNDFKLIVAYSSVVHMGMMLMGLFTMSMVGFLGGMVMMVGHGFCSSALFLLINYVYERSKTRNLLINKGLIYFMPSLSMWWFIFCVMNMSAPISLNLVSELLILTTLLNWSTQIFLFLILGMYLSSVYSLYLFSYSQHGVYSNLLMKFNLSSVNNFLMMFIHWIPLNFLILKMEIFY